MSIYIFSQMDVVCERYRVLTDFPNMQKVNWSKSTCRTADVSSTTGDIIMFMWHHQEVTRVPQIWCFRANLAPVRI
jgi:hypothetical protein